MARVNTQIGHPQELPNILRESASIYAEVVEDLVHADQHADAVVWSEFVRILRQAAQDCDEAIVRYS